MHGLHGGDPRGFYSRMSLADIELSFPRLKRDQNYERASDSDFNYNCLAFVLGDKSNWWEPPGLFGYYWPPGFPEDVSVGTATEILKLHGFVIELESGNEPATESIAIYADGEEWTHFAKFSNGVWASKLGEDHDITHSSLELLEGDKYGRVIKILSKSKS